MPCNLLSLPLILLYMGGYAQLSHLILPLHDDLEIQNLCVCAGGGLHFIRSVFGCQKSSGSLGWGQVT